jgi:predicted metal-dependent hydrolase
MRCADHCTELFSKQNPTYLLAVPFDFFRKLARDGAPKELLEVNGQPVPLVLVRHPRARRYILRLQPDGAARVTIPRGGSATEALRFAARNQAWLVQALQRQATRPVSPRQWTMGTTIFFRGEPVLIEPAADTEAPQVRFGSEVISVVNPHTDLRPAIEKHLRQIAVNELPPRVAALANSHHLAVHRITVRNQRSRWGSCSRRGTISLNWRLLQTPRHVQDYIILHELMHLRQMNHSARFWHEVKNVCPDYEIAERWLKQNASLLR